MDQTSDASPSIEDCLQIIRNIQYDGDTQWDHTVVGHNQREVAKYGSCAFGIEASKTKGNVKFWVGGQDVIDLINSSIENYGKNGRVGAKGDMLCNGNLQSQEVTWGLY